MNDKASLYRNAIHCAGSVLKNEGPLAFYKGFTMCFLVRSLCSPCSGIVILMHPVHVGIPTEIVAPFSPQPARL